MRGKAHLFSRAHIGADDILAPVHATTRDAGRLAAHVLERLDAGFAARVEPGDVVVAGEDFGCGSAREHAVWALRGAKVAAVVARSFARIFFRNALNNGFLVIECPEAVERTTTGDLLEIDLREGVVRNLTRGESFGFAPFTPFAMEILEAGGLLPYVMRRPTGASSA
jgi:3-isopropylmalate/(R)-2-methylmalate dehydratase small subunit